MKKIIVNVLIMAFVVIMFASGCGKETTEITEKQTGSYEVETLKQAANGDWGAPTPFLHSTRGPGTHKMTMVFDSLLTAGTQGLIPWLAKSYSVDDLTYMFSIHENAVWHDGKPVTTEDIAFTIDYYKEFPPAQDVSYTLGAGDDFVIADYEIIDSYNIIITAKQKLASNERNIGSFAIIPKHVWSNVEDPYTYKEPDAFTGCGMYQLTAYDAATGSYAFEAFEPYYGRQAAAKILQFVPVSDPLLAFENGEIDITSVPADLKQKYASDPDIKIMEKSDDFGYKLLINFDRLPVFLDLEMRKALYQAIDRQAMVDSIYRGNGHIASAGHIPQSSIYYNPQVITYDYDPESARAALADKNIELNLTCEETGDAANVAQLVKMNLEAAGIKVTVEAYDTATRDSKVFNGNYDLAISSHGGWNMTPDYMKTLYSDISKGKTMSPLALTSKGYTNDKITQLAEAQSFETDFNKRIDLFKELQLEVSKEIPILPLITQVQMEMFRPAYYDHWKKEFDFQQFNLGRISYILNQDDI